MHEFMLLFMTVAVVIQISIFCSKFGVMHGYRVIRYEYS